MDPRKEDSKTQVVHSIAHPIDKETLTTRGILVFTARDGQGISTPEEGIQIPATTTSRHPQTKWAQRSDKVFLTIELSDAKDVKLNLQPDGHFSFSATGPDNVPYAIDFELFDKVNVEDSKAAVGLRNICYLVKKAEKKWWSRLLKQEGKPPVYLKVDWDKWVDEDDENENKFGGMDFGDMDFSNLGMGGGDDDFDAGGDDDEEDEEMADTKVGDEDKTGEAEVAPDSNGSEAKA